MLPLGELAVNLAFMFGPDVLKHLFGNDEQANKFYDKAQEVRAIESGAAEGLGGDVAGLTQTKELKGMLKNLGTNARAKLLAGVEAAKNSADNIRAGRSSILGSVLKYGLAAGGGVMLGRMASHDDESQGQIPPEMLASLQAGGMGSPMAGAGMRSQLLNAQLQQLLRQNSEEGQSAFYNPN